MCPDKSRNMHEAYTLAICTGQHATIQNVTAPPALKTAHPVCQILTNPTDDANCSFQGPLKKAVATQATTATTQKHLGFRSTTRQLLCTIWVAYLLSPHLGLALALAFAIARLCRSPHTCKRSSLESFLAFSFNRCLFRCSFFKRHVRSFFSFVSASFCSRSCANRLPSTDRRNNKHRIITIVARHLPMFGLAALKNCDTVSL